MSDWLKPGNYALGEVLQRLSAASSKDEVAWILRSFTYIRHAHHDPEFEERDQFPASAVLRNGHVLPLPFFLCLSSGVMMTPA